ncbi:MAG TPA: hypothetical protein IAC50_05475 [Candidatus Copromorpha excrementigallinarum]|uniref:Uncharacterized protein n=1 Tax=Candidatus Allocopromorpha excrementigallinarum TaxID=2840742 RepID=A0A9D1L6N6_9FIRM|nr:hypothetical protein [Candidatus Copromorpha excrementigallinarum]
MNGFGVDIKSAIAENVKRAVTEFERRDDVVTAFGDPVIGYADTKNPLFDMFFTRGLSDHPKGIYRPGSTVVVHFVPYGREVIKAGPASDKWIRAFTESMWLSMRINGVIRETLDTVGRLSSCTNTPTDWNEDTCHEEWSHKMAAFAAGMGPFGPGGCLITEKGFAGRFGSIITDGKYADEYPPLSSKQLEDIYDEIMRQCRWEGFSGVSCGEEMISVCPAGAVSQRGINRKKCQAHCKTIDQYIPSPDICGRCFGCK